MKPTSSTSPSAAIPRIVLTSGEPAGVGPELCLALAACDWPCELVCLADAALLAARARLLGLAVILRPYAGASGGSRPARTRHEPHTLLVAHAPLKAPSVPGQLAPANAAYVLGLLDRAIDGALSREFDAVVTAPVHKGVIIE
jgi:4-hydroxythreonine-4-phosphate dehydrogenase